MYGNLLDVSKEQVGYKRGRIGARSKNEELSGPTKGANLTLSLMSPYRLLLGKRSYEYGWPQRWPLVFFIVICGVERWMNIPVGVAEDCNVARRTSRTYSPSPFNESLASKIGEAVRAPSRILLMVFGLQDVNKQTLSSSSGCGIHQTCVRLDPEIYPVGNLNVRCANSK